MQNKNYTTLLPKPATQLVLLGDLWSLSVALNLPCFVIDNTTDTSLGLDSNANLSVNPSAFVNNQSIRVDANGRLTSGLIFQSVNNLGIRNNNEVFLDLHTGGNLEFDGEILTDVRTFSNGLHENSSHEVSLDLTVEGALEMNASKTNIRDILTASNGVTRVGNEIRGAYVAGQNISISGSTISCTKPDEQPYIGEMESLSHQHQ
ncbi:hypothetical protein DFS34DRAFT_369318 [Phlyctochytrium arcticum]|nr:hypothetical protein DFS34DRAFT_369318 [Phlyctochytrium arcticum]